MLCSALELLCSAQGLRGSWPASAQDWIGVADDYWLPIAPCQAGFDAVCGVGHISQEKQDG